MTFWYLLILGLVTYLIVQRNVVEMTTTPVWILWLILMMPAILWSLWSLRYGQNIPLGLFIAPLLISFILYWLLFQWGRKSVNSKQTQTATTESQSATHNTAESLPVRPLDRTEETQLRNCFPWSVYYIQNIDYLPQAIICRGQLRTTPTQAYQRIKANIEAQFGDRFLVIFQEGVNGKPFFMLVPYSLAAKRNNIGSQEKLTRPRLALSLFLATLVTTTLVGTTIADPELTLTTLLSNPLVLVNGLPYSLGLLSILGIHELGHYFTARFYKIRPTLPYFIPVPFFLGTFGALIQMRSPVPNRKALFDVGIAGPLFGFIVTVPLLMWGLAHSEIVTQTDKAGILDPNALNPKYSFLLALFSKLALGSQLTPESAIDLHPLAVAGCLGLIITALNLMPVGQLDGGHIVHAMLGQRTAIIIGQISRLLLLLLSLIQPGFFLWAIILLFMPLMDEPALNDVTELDNKRDIAGLLAMALLVMIILPLPQTIANWLQM
ncbi:MAG: site-2 protease family protein [Nostocaceae cyanobacterium]|nr:site-2 protease family protein [Nostocaceae cyanobacterium]